MFWINKGGNGQTSIEAAGMDGSMRRVIAVITAQEASSLTLDYTVERLYWMSKYKEVKQLSAFLFTSVLGLSVSLYERWVWRLQTSNDLNYKMIRRENDILMKALLSRTV